MDKITCNVCGKVCPSKKSYAGHMRLAHGIIVGEKQELKNKVEEFKNKYLDYLDLYHALDKKYTDLQEQYKKLEQKYESLLSEYNNLKQDYDSKYSIELPEDKGKIEIE
jgi:uncharacterized C2H2 Zn-finger protein